MKPLQKHPDRPDHITLNLFGGGSIQVPAKDIKEVNNKGTHCDVKIGVQRIKVIEKEENLRAVMAEYAEAE